MVPPAVNPSDVVEEDMLVGVGVAAKLTLLAWLESAPRKSDTFSTEKELSVPTTVRSGMWKQATASVVRRHVREHVAHESQLVRPKKPRYLPAPFGRGIGAEIIDVVEHEERRAAVLERVIARAEHAA